MEELRELRASYELKIREYEELMDIRIQLDQEIATYCALLQEVENRWGRLLLFLLNHCRYILVCCEIVGMGYHPCPHSQAEPDTYPS